MYTDYFMKERSKSNFCNWLVLQELFSLRIAKKGAVMAMQNQNNFCSTIFINKNNLIRQYKMSQLLRKYSQIIRFISSR